MYRAEDVQRELGLHREDLVAFAYFLGSDYTPGVNGVGIVNAVEIIQAFSMRADTGGPVAGLKRFREWLEGFDFVSAVRSRFDAGSAGGGGGKRKRENDEDDETETAQNDEEVGGDAVDSKQSTAEAKLVISDFVFAKLVVLIPCLRSWRSRPSTKAGGPSGRCRPLSRTREWSPRICSHRHPETRSASSGECRTWAR